MKKTTILSIFISILLLSIGVLIYFFANKSTFVFIIFLRNYGADFCWMFSFVFALHPFISQIFQKSTIITISICCLCGIFFEILQKFNVINGTGDICDIISYLSAAILSCLLIKYIYKREKNYEKTF